MIGFLEFFWEHPRDDKKDGINKTKPKPWPTKEMPTIFFLYIMTMFWALSVGFSLLFLFLYGFPYLF